MNFVAQVCFAMYFLPTFALFIFPCLTFALFYRSVSAPVILLRCGLSFLIEKKRLKKYLTIQLNNIRIYQKNMNI